MNRIKHQINPSIIALFWSGSLGCSLWRDGSGFWDIWRSAFSFSVILDLVERIFTSQTSEVWIWHHFIMARMQKLMCIVMALMLHRHQIATDSSVETHRETWKAAVQHCPSQFQIWARQKWQPLTLQQTAKNRTDTSKIGAYTHQSKSDLPWNKLTLMDLIFLLSLILFVFVKKWITWTTWRNSWFVLYASKCLQSLW